MILIGIALKCGDCLDYLNLINDESADLVLTDPPYNISRRTNFASGEKTGRDVDRFRISMHFGDWDDQFDNENTLKNVLQETYRILKRGGTIICFYDLWKISYLKKLFESCKYKQIRFIEWMKTNPVPINSKINYLTNAREIAVVGCKYKKPVFNSEYDNGVYHYPICHGKERLHPTQKPLKLIEELILKHSNKNDTVLDPFMGSGTTGVACKNLGRNFIGIELNKDYFEAAKTRINSA